MSSVAILGVNGLLGAPILESLTSDEVYKHLKGPVTAYTRDASKAPVSGDRVNYKENKNIEDIDLSGIDVFINLTDAVVTSASVEKVIEKSGKSLKLYIPSEFGVDIANVPIKPLPKAFAAKEDHSSAVRALGVKTIEYVTGFFDVPGTFLTEWVGHVGVNPADQSVTPIGNPSTKLATSVLKDIGNYVAASIAFQSDYAKLPNTLRFYSNLVSAEQIVQRYEKSKGITLKVNPTIPFDKALKEADAKSAEGLTTPDAFFFYLHVIAAGGVDKGLDFSSNDRELINPGEKYFKWSPFK